MYKIKISLAVTLLVFVHITKSDILVQIRNSNQIIEEFHDLPARFGAAFPMNGLRALAAVSNPSNACQAIEPPPTLNTTKPQRFVVIIARGNCSFEDKVRNAQKAGFNAAIVHNVGSNELEPMSANNGDDIDIPSMFVGESTGKIIIYNYLYPEGFALVLNDDLPFNINTHLIVPFCIVVGLCFIIMIGLLIMKCIREQRRLRRHRLPGSALKKIPIIRFSKEEHGLQYEICAICIEDYVDGDRLRVLPCSHAYHNKCIDPWLTKNRRVCPICKRKVFARDEPRRRRRRSTDDSMSDSDNDDTTPLINPVDQSNTHGTFQPNAPPQEEGDPNALNQQQRFNPFDRQANLLLPSAEIVDSESFWARIMRTIRAQTNELTRRNEGSVENPEEIRNIMQSQSNEEQPIGSYTSSSSNNVLNTNLSGSLKRFQRSNQSQKANDTDSGDDDANDAEQFHECKEPIQTIFAPISTSHPTMAPLDQQQQSFFTGNETASTSHQRIAVAALPNLDFEHTSPMTTRPFSTSSPSIYSENPHQNSEASDSNQRHGNFIRNTTASSSNYFV